MYIISEVDSRRLDLFIEKKYGIDYENMKLII